MIQRTITTDCINLGSKIAKVLLILTGFVREVREARADIDRVSRELHSLQGVLDLLKEDAALFPPQLGEQTPAVVEHCSNVVDELDASLATLSSSDLPKQEKRTQWLEAGRQSSARFRTKLEAHKAILGVALDLVGATTAERNQQSADVVEDASRILVEMQQLQMRMPGEFEATPDPTLHDYMNELQTYAETIIRRKENEYEAERQREEVEQQIDQGAFMGEKELFGAYVGDLPDSAIDVSVEPVFKTLKDALAKNSEGVLDMDEVMETILENGPSRAPTPPPKDSKRLELARIKMASSPDTQPNSPTQSYSVVTRISSDGRTVDPPSLNKPRRGLGRFFGPIKDAIVENRPYTRSTDSTTSSDVRPSTPVIQASLVRKGSRRLSVAFKKMPMWNAELLEEPEGPNNSLVFGVSLQKSMQVAKGTAKTHHSGNGGSSRREFPLCMQKCCFFIKNEGVEAPDIFAEPGDRLLVAKLKDIFSSAPTFGEDIDWENFGVYEAADLILLYLSQLPKPLVTETIAKRWISLSRQATLSGSHGTRLDQCIDFWEEALGGLRGPSRSLFKLLLNLWGDIADAADKNDMTAERLAAVVIKPLMHVSSAKYDTDYMLSLAFLIRKRSEYTELLKKDQKEVKRISRAAW
ncbi:Rho GTPase activation protein [Biscogniauxia mediterranea]|nr:Rho GTPase activation protein [Biscogniauxia mediterranea]